MDKRRVARILIMGAIVAGSFAAFERLTAQHTPPSAAGSLFVLRTAGAPSADASQSPGAENARLAPISVDYPADGSIFPPRLRPPPSSGAILRKAPQLGGSTWSSPMARPG